MRCLGATYSPSEKHSTNTPSSHRFSCPLFHEEQLRTETEGVRLSDCLCVRRCGVGSFGGVSSSSC